MESEEKDLMTDAEAREFNLSKNVEDNNFEAIQNFVDYLLDFYSENPPTKVFITKGVHELYKDNIGDYPVAFMAEISCASDGLLFIEIVLLENFNGEALFFNWDKNSNSFMDIVNNRLNKYYEGQ